MTNRETEPNTTNGPYLRGFRRWEIVFRRIGRNEESAQRLISRSREKDGLYWPALSGEDESPLGDLIAAAAAEGYSVSRSGESETPPEHFARVDFRNDDRVFGIKDSDRLSQPTQPASSPHSAYGSSRSRPGCR